MSVTTTGPPITADELEDVRWLAREALAYEVQPFVVGDPPGDPLARATGVTELAWAIGACGMEDDEARWPGDLDARYAAIVLRAADRLEEMNAFFLKDSRDDERLRAFFARQVERIRGARVVLGRVS